MNHIRYNKIVEYLPSEIRMKLEQIKMFLSQGKASVMVGAGFSKNAHQSEFAAMKDWSGLTKVFYNQLFVRDDDRKDNSDLLYEPLKVTQMYECSFGRNALDALIQSSLPNETTKPGKMHEELMKLPWRDVFTTNYDTLLERAANGTDRSYQVVTNKETLLYANSPRIIKLHGSFPNIRPYIITEEDFRTYPQKYPEFVNTVRQALMESLFCLMGFSGNDPNFLQWLGWLRDVMGNQASPVYLITYEKEIHKAQVDLFKRRGIEIINVATIKEGMSYAEGLEFVLTFLAKDKSKVWKPSIDRTSPRTKEAILSLTKQMQEIHKEYPNYLYLPEKYHQAFDNEFPLCSWTDKGALRQLTKTERLHFIYEVVWRYEVSMSPILDEWILDEMETIALKEAYNEEDVFYQNEIQLYLLTEARIYGDHDCYRQVADVLSNTKLNASQKHRLYYEQCLHELGLLHYDVVRGLLMQWNVNGTETRSALWKAGVLTEIGEDNEAINLLNITSQWVRQSLLTQQDKQHISSSYLGALDDIQKLHEGRVVADSALELLKSHIVQKISAEDEKPSSTYEQIHKFTIDSVQSVWHSTTNQASLVQYAYKYIRLLECVGYPIGHSKFTIDEPWLTKAIEPLMRSMPTFALCTLIRSRSKKVTLNCMSRKNIIKLSAEWADSQYLIYKKTIENYLCSKMEKESARRVGDVLLPAIAHLSTRLREDLVLEFWAQYLQYYNSDLHGYDKSHFAIIQENIFAEGRMQTNREIFTANYENEDKGLPWSSLWLRMSSVSNTSVDLLSAKIKNVSAEEEPFVLNRAMMMLMAELSPMQHRKLNRVISAWRSRNTNDSSVELILDTYRFANYIRNIDKKDAEAYLSEIVRNIEDIEIEGIRSTSPMSKFEENCRLLSQFVGKMTPQQHEIVITKLYQMLKVNKQQFSKDDSSYFLGGLREKVQRMLSVFNNYICDVDLSRINKDLLNDLTEVCVEYLNKKVATMYIIARLDNEIHCYDEEEMVNMLRLTILSDNHYVYSSGLQAIRVVGCGDVRETMVQMLIEYAEYTLNRKMKSFVFTIMCLLEDGLLDKNMWAEMMDRLLIRVADGVAHFDEDEEIRMDIMYYTNMLAGVKYAKWGDSEGVERWREITLDRKYFNDVRSAFDIGQSRVIKNKKDLLARLILKSNYGM